MSTHNENVAAIKKKFREFLDKDGIAGDLSPEGLVLLGIAVLAEEQVPEFSVQKDIHEFHRKFGIEYKGDTRKLPVEKMKNRVKHMREELTELDNAVKQGNPVAQVDALMDLIYLAVGTLYLQGFNFKECWKEVHESNMTRMKVPMGEGKHGTNIVKGDKFIEPNYVKFINNLDAKQKVDMLKKFYPEEFTLEVDGETIKTTKDEEH